MADGPQRTSIITAWNDLAATLGRKSPKALQRSKIARKGIRGLMGHGRR